MYVEPGIASFLRKFNVQMYNAYVVRAFKAARMACPVKVQELHSAPAQVEALREFPILDDDDLINNLKAQMPEYCAEADGVQVEAGKQMEWWYAQMGRLPHWSAVARMLVLVQPSSAASERVFSLLKAAFCDQQQSTLEDELEASLMPAQL